MADAGIGSMMGHRRITCARSRGGAARILLAAAAIVLLLAQAAAGEEPREPETTTAAQTQPRGSEPGFLHALGRWVDDSLANIGLNNARGTLDDFGGRTGEVAKDAVGAAKDAAESVVRLPSTRIVSGRQKCELAGNGAPDCQAAASAACRSKGFSSGRSVDIESAQKCPARVWLSGRPPAPGECSLETFVTRAICQ
jgi:hypothetical protein